MPYVMNEKSGEAYDVDDLNFWLKQPGFKKVSKAVGQAAQQANAIKELREMLKPGDTIYTSLKHVSRSGMYRKISLLMHTNEGIRNISSLVSKAIDAKYVDGAIGVGGCGMDMGFHLVYSLSRVLFQGRFECAGKGKCHSNDHYNGDHNYEPHQHSDGGYALKHQWV